MFSDIQNLHSFFPPINYPYLYTRKTTSYSRLIMAGIYLHIPFCKRRCIYCDFFSTTENDKKSTYVQALSKELELRKDYLDGEIIDTIYFGGGTPSQLEEKDFIQLFETIYKIYTINPKAEITIEANPDDLTPQYIAMLRTLPFNRLSMGIQTFKEDTLRLLHRRHTAAQAQQAYQHCREAGFQNISIDLMYGLPGETLEECVAREVKEETGMEVKKAEYLFSLPNIYVYSGFTVHTLDLFFRCTVTDTLHYQAMDDAADVFFLPLKDIHTEDFGLSSIRKGVGIFLKEMGE